MVGALKQQTRSTLRWRLGYISVLAGVLLVISGCGGPKATPGGGAPGGNSAGASPSIKAITGRGKVILPVSNNVPCLYKDEAGKIAGLHTVVNLAIAKRLGVSEIEYAQVDWSGVIPGLQANRWDWIGDCMAVTAERKQAVNFSDPIYKLGRKVAVLKGNPKKVHLMANLKGLRVGALVASAEFTELDKLGGVTVLTHQDLAAGVADLKAGRIDAVYNDEFSLYPLRKNPDPAVEIVDDFDSGGQVVVGVAVRKADTDLLKEVNTVIAQMRSDGSLQKVLEQWGLSKFNMDGLDALK